MTIEEQTILSRLALINGSIKDLEEVLACHFPSVDNEHIKEQINANWERHLLWSKALKYEALYQK